MNKSIALACLASSLALSGCNENVDAIDNQDYYKIGITIESTKLDEFVNQLLFDISFLENLGSGTTEFTNICVSGDASSTFTDNDSDGNFNYDNNITLVANNCITSNSELLNGSYTYQSNNEAGTEYSASFSRYSYLGNYVNGNLDVVENNYSLQNGTGNLDISIPALTQDNTTISNGIYSFTLASTSTYSYEANYSVTAPETGLHTITTQTPFEGEYTLTSMGFSVDNPIVGVMTITSDNTSPITINANTGNPATFLATENSNSIELDW